MELSLSHMLHIFNIFREYDGKDNCAQVLEEEIYKMFVTKYVNDELLGDVAENEKFLRFTKINLWSSSSNEREECIYIPL